MLSPIFLYAKLNTVNAVIIITAKICNISLGILPPFSVVLITYIKYMQKIQLYINSAQIDNKPV